jgi:alanyl-tRNA synthetase
LRFDFTHPNPVSPEQLEQIETWVNNRIIQDFDLAIQFEAQDKAIDKGAIALFGEIYGETVRTISIGADPPISYELCGGTHVPSTGAIGPFLVLSEGSVAAGIRRIEAITGRASLERIRSQLRALREIAEDLSVPIDQVRPRVQKMLADQVALTQQAESVRKQGALAAFQALQPRMVAGIPILTGVIEDADDETLRSFADQFREEYPSGVAVLSSVRKDRPFFIAAVSDDLVARGLHAGNLVKAISQIVGGGGGGKAHLAQAGGSDTSRIEEALEAAHRWMEDHLGTE